MNELFMYICVYMYVCICIYTHVYNISSILVKINCIYICKFKTVYSYIYYVCIYIHVHMYNTHIHTHVNLQVNNISHLVLNLFSSGKKVLPGALCG